MALEILRRIPRTHKITASELHVQLLAQGFTRDIRTIQRQLEMLTSHFDIECDARSKPYGYIWRENAKTMTVAQLSPSESLLLGLAAEHLRHLLPAPVMQRMDSFFQQADRNLRSDSNTALEREWRQKIRVVATSQPLLPPKIGPGIFEAVSEALYYNRWLKLDYRNAASQRKSAEVMPLGLAQQGPRLYLVCRFKDYDNERSLALHRMRAAEVTTQGFHRPGDFDLKQYDDAGRFGYGNGQHIRLQFRITKEAGLHLLESPLSKDQTVQELDDAYVIDATVVETAMLEWWLRGFGDAVSRVKRTPVDHKAIGAGSFSVAGQ